MKTLLAWTYSAITALLILGISMIGLRSPRPMIDVRTIPLITHSGGLTPQSPPGEMFRCEQNGLQRIDILLVAIGPSLHPRATLRLRANSPSGVVLRETTISPSVYQTGPAWVSFEFEPVTDSKDKVFHFSLEPADEAATQLSPWVRFHGQTGENDAWGDRFLEPGATHRGNFVSDHAHLRALAFPVESMLPSLGTARLELFDGPGSKDPVRVATLPVLDEVHAGWTFFSFEQIPESRWKRYYFELQTPEHCRLIGTGGENGEGIPVYKTFHGLDVTESSLFGMTRGALRQPDRDLVFRAWGEDPPSAVFARLMERTGDDLWLAAILWCLATAICLRVFVFVDPDPRPEVVSRSAPTVDPEVSPAPPAD